MNAHPWAVKNTSILAKVAPIPVAIFGIIILLHPSIPVKPGDTLMWIVAAMLVMVVLALPAASFFFGSIAEANLPKGDRLLWPARIGSIAGFLCFGFMALSVLLMIGKAVLHK